MGRPLLDRSTARRVGLVTATCWPAEYPGGPPSLIVAIHNLRPGRSSNVYVTYNCGRLSAQLNNTDGRESSVVLEGRPDRGKDTLKELSMIIELMIAKL